MVGAGDTWSEPTSEVPKPGAAKKKWKTVKGGPEPYRRALLTDEEGVRAACREAPCSDTENAPARGVYAGERGGPGSDRDAKPEQEYIAPRKASGATVMFAASLAIAGEVATGLTRRHLPERCGGTAPREEGGLSGVGVIGDRPVLPARADPA